MLLAYAESTLWGVDNLRG
ncbi:hypothetical protein VCHC57A2_2140, partial [Vibrio cholerae HC-57A2]